jgi:CBS domain-containing protein
MKLESVLAAKGQMVFTVTPDDSIAEAVRRLAQHNIGALVVVNQDGAPVGMLSERDVIRYLAVGSDVLSKTAGDLMSTSITTGTLGDDVDAVFHTMTHRRFRHLPVLDDGRLVGLVSLGDLVKAVLTDYQGAVANLETQLLSSSQSNL